MNFESWPKEERLLFLQFCFPQISPVALESYLDEHESEESEESCSDDIVQWIIEKQSSVFEKCRESEHLMTLELQKIFPNVPNVPQILRETGFDFYTTLEILLSSNSCSSVDGVDGVDGNGSSTSRQDPKLQLREIFPDLDDDKMEDLIVRFQGNIEEIDNFLEIEKISQDPKIAQLQDIFPQIPIRHLDEILYSKSDGNIDLAIRELLKDDINCNYENHFDDGNCNLRVELGVREMFPNLNFNYICKVCEILKGDQSKIIDWLITNPDPGTLPTTQNNQRNRKKYISIPPDFIFNKDDQASLLLPGTPAQKSDISAKRDPNLSYAKALTNEKVPEKVAKPVGELLNGGGSNGAEKSFWGSNDDTNPMELRQSATSNYSNCKYHFQKAMESYQRKGKHGKAIAAYYAQLGRQSHAKMQSDNRKASQLLFSRNNPNYPHSLNKVDLHGLFVTEAIRYVDETLDIWLSLSASASASASSSNPNSMIVFITGRGSHSSENYSKIKVAVEKHLSKMALRKGFLVTGSPVSKKDGFTVTMVKAEWYEPYRNVFLIGKTQTQEKGEDNQSVTNIFLPMDLYDKVSMRRLDQWKSKAQHLFSGTRTVCMNIAVVDEEDQDCSDYHSPIIIYQYKEGKLTDL